MTGATATLTKQDVDRLAREFEAAFARADIAAVTAFYTEDALIMPPDSAPVRGRPASEQRYRGMREQRGITALAFHPQEVVASGDLAYEVGTATVRREAPDGQASETAIKYLVAWRRHADGAWRIAVDIFNQDAPAAPA